MLGIYRFIVRLFGGTPYIGGKECPRCKFSFGWDGRACTHCGYPRARPSGSISERSRGGATERSGPGAQPFATPPPLPTRRTDTSAVAKPPTPVKRDETAGLDPGMFTPVTDAEAFAGTAARRGSLFANPWFGRRDLIPPVTDERTLLIDRAMVGHGIITPEELKEIHDVGEQMDEIRPDLLHARAAADAAVQADRAQREEIKKQKKAEAEERKRKHREAVEHRKRTDIIFLGRGVSRGLADRRANVEKLQQAGLPVMATPADVANAMKLEVSRLRWLAYHTEAATRTHYVRFTVAKKSGGTRELAAPHRELAATQEWVLREVLSKVATHDAAHGFVPTRSTLTNATPHVGRAVVVNADLKDFFPTITFPRVKGVFQQLGYSPAVATVLALLCTESPRRVVTYAGQRFEVATGPRALPQGACTSPAISNLVARRLDSRLTGIAEKLGWTYTRYADDLTFSADTEGDDPNTQVGYLLARVRHITQEEGFAVNEKKTRVLRRNHRQSVTGIVVNARPAVPRKTVRRLRAILHRAKSEGLAAQNRDDHPNFEGWVQGMIAYVQMVNPQQGEKLAAALAEIKS